MLYKKITGEDIDPKSTHSELLQLINNNKIELKKSADDNIYYSKYTGHRQIKSI